MGGAWKGVGGPGGGGRDVAWRGGADGAAVSCMSPHPAGIADRSSDRKRTSGRRAKAIMLQLPAVPPPLRI